MHLMLFSISRLLDAWFICASLGLIFNFQSHKWAGLCIFQVSSISKQSSVSITISVIPVYLGCFIARGDRYYQIYMLSQSLIGLDVMTLVCLLVVSASCLVVQVYPGWARSSRLWLCLAWKLSKEELLSQHVEPYGFDGWWKTSRLQFQLRFRSIATTSAVCNCPRTPCSMLAQSTLRYITTTFESEL